MSTDYVNLAVMTGRESWASKSKLEYKEAWPGYDWASFASADGISQGLEETAYRQLQIGSEATISDVISAARRLIGRSNPEYEIDSEGEWPVSYSLYCPALNDDALPESIRLSELGVMDGEMMVLRRTVAEPDFGHPRMALVKDFADFNKMVSWNGNPDDQRSRSGRHIELYANLLYTDEDVDLTTFVRRHFDELHKMSGPNIMVYVVETPPNDSAYAASKYWRAKLDYGAYLAWSLFGLVRSKPYDKSHAYEIARTLGVYPDQLPCIVLFYSVTQSDKLIIPIQGKHSQLFRQLFSTTQKLLDSPSSDHELNDPRITMSYLDARSFAERRSKELFEELRTAVERTRTDSREDRTVFNFYGQTVFINRPSGKLNLRYFHRILRR